MPVCLSVICAYLRAYQVLPTGSLATLLQGQLVLLNSAAGSPKMDMAQVICGTAHSCAMRSVPPELQPSLAGSINATASR